MTYGLSAREAPVGSQNDPFIAKDPEGIGIRADAAIE
jgi:hypothetical protein